MKAEEAAPKGVEFQMDTPETPDGNEILMIASCAYEPGLFQVWTEGGYSSNSSQLYDTYFCDWEGRQRTPLFQAYGVEDEDNCFATPIIGWDGAIGMLPQLLTDEEQAEFLQLIGEE